MNRRSFVALPALAVQPGPKGLSEGIIRFGVKVEEIEFKGRRAMHITPAPGETGEKLVAVLPAFQDFRDGTIGLDLAGAPGAAATETARGFVGVAFRIQPNAERYECLYLRPTNGRADDQVRRNHSVQYISFPDYPWHRLRKEFPEKYESYVDLQPAVWTQVKITVAGTKARLYVHGAEQPTLVVNDLKLGEVSGPIGMWIGPGTDSYFSNLKVTR